MNNRIQPRKRLVLLLLVAVTAAGFAVPAAAGPNDSGSADFDDSFDTAMSNEPAVRRYGLFVGANDGGSDRVRLRYAESDALAVAAMLQRAGGLAEERTILLQDPTPAELAEGLRAIDRRIRSGRARAAKNSREELVFYYSGHSDETGLLLGGNSYGYRELRAELKAVAADVHIAILDSCSSGAFTRLKGGMRRSPFLFDESTEAAGHAFLTSSSASEAAQESDEIRGSFFTHYLLAALSGAADASRDQRVSLNEAYSFASQETLARTEYTLAGPQHPSYDINLTGTGDLVLTDLREGVERIGFAEALSGRISIRDAWNRPVLEMYKEADRPVTITLPPGRYTVTLDNGRSLQSAGVTLYPGGSVMLGSGQFRRISRSPSVARGGPDYEYESPYEADRRREEDSYGPAGDAAYEGVEINLVSVRSGGMEGIQMGLVGSIVEGGMTGIQMSSVFNISEGPMDGVQMAGVLNIAEGTVQGPQLAGVFNMVEGSVRGPQLAGVFNMVEGSVQGPQLAGVFNMAEGDRTEGIQAAGVFNASGSLDGAQFGVVNVAKKVNGMQVGIVNISEELYGVPIGLVNIAGNGLHHLSAWYDDGEMINFGFQLGTFYYTFFTAGLSAGDRDRAFSSGLGMGLELPLGGFYVDAEVYAENYSEGAGSFEANVNEVFAEGTIPYPAARLSLGRSFGNSRSGIFAGVDMSVRVRGYTPFVPEVMSGEHWSFDYSGEGDMVDIYPRWFIGLRL
jgi:hypothetical protein